MATFRTRPPGLSRPTTAAAPEFRYAARRWPAASSPASRAVVARAGVIRFALRAPGPVSACLTTSHIAAEKARNTTASSGMYSHVKFVTAASIDCAGRGPAVICYLQAAAPRSGGPQAGFRVGSECELAGHGRVGIKIGTIGVQRVVDLGEPRFLEDRISHGKDLMAGAYTRSAAARSALEPHNDLQRVDAVRAIHVVVADQRAEDP